MRHPLDRIGIPPISSDPLQLAREYKTNPTGRHSGDLQVLLNYMRTLHFGGRVIILSSQEGRCHRLARINADRGVEYLDDGAFANATAAEWRLFELRWREIYGSNLPVGS
jgi:hypothetical protein